MAVEEAVVGALARRGGALLEHFGRSHADRGGVGGDRRRQGDEEREVKETMVVLNGMNESGG